MKEMEKTHKDKNKSLSDSVFSGLFWKFGERLLAQVTSFVVSIVLARILMPEDYGSVAIVMVFIAFADVFVVSGFSTSLIQKKNANETDFSSIFYCSLVVSILLYIVLFFTSPAIAGFYNMPELVLVTRVFALRLPLSAYNSVQHAFVSRHMMFKKFFFSTLFGTILSGVVGIVLAYSGAGVWALVAQYMTNSIVDSIVLTITVRWRPRLLFSWSASRKLMKYGWKILAADFSGTFFNELKGLVIGKVYTTSDLAFYNRGNKLVNVVTENVRSSVMSVLFPAMANVEDDRERIKTITRKSIRTMAYIIFPATVGFFVIAEPLVSTLLTDKWLPAVFFLRVAAVSAAIEMIGHISLQCLKAIGRSDLVLINDIINKPIFVGLLFIGIQRGVDIMCLMLLISSVFGTIINLIACQKCIHYKTKEVVYDVFKPFIVSLLMGGVISLYLLLPINNALKVITMGLSGGILYVLLSNIFKDESYVYLKGIIGKKVSKHVK